MMCLAEDSNLFRIGITQFRFFLKLQADLLGIRPFSSFHIKIDCFSSKSFSRGSIECFLKRGRAGSPLFAKLINRIAFLVLGFLVSM